MTMTEDDKKTALSMLNKIKPNPLTTYSSRFCLFISPKKTGYCKKMNNLLKTMRNQIENDEFRDLDSFKNEFKGRYKKEIFKIDHFEFTGGKRVWQDLNAHYGSQDREDNYDLYAKLSASYENKQEAMKTLKDYFGLNIQCIKSKFLLEQCDDVTKENASKSTKVGNVINKKSQLAIGELQTMTRSISPSH